MEWDALISCGKARLRVRFEGGTMTGFGASPATYTTSNPAAQHIIENSEYFREKRIRLIRIIPDARSAKGKKTALQYEEKMFNDPQLARDFLHDTFDVPYSSMLTMAQIKEQGKLFGFRLSWRK